MSVSKKPFKVTFFCIKKPHKNLEPRIILTYLLCKYHLRWMKQGIQLTPSRQKKTELKTSSEFKTLTAFHS